LYQFFAAAILIFHLTFIVFVLGGSLLVLRWPALAWIHIPAVAWGIMVETMAWICPLTPLENHFLTLAGGVPYAGDGGGGVGIERRDLCSADTRALAAI
jgi:uncharacterized membrane protein YhhN